MDAAEQGRRLAERHRTGESPKLDSSVSLLNYAEVPYEGDWTLRSGLMRLAQPHPALVGSVLELSRRLDAAVGHVRKELERHVVVGDRRLTAEGLDAAAVQPIPEIRTADLGRLAAAGADPDDLVSGYGEVGELGNEERLAVPLLALAVDFEGLAETVTAWALVGPNDPPVDRVTQVVDQVRETMDELGVPVETGPPPGMRRGSRG